MTNDKHNRAYDFLLDFAESSPEAAAKELLLACFNILSADAFVDMAEEEFGFEDTEEEEEEDTEDENSWGTCCHDTSRIHCSICSVVGSDITHLINTIGVVVCGSMNAEDTTADINFVTCEDCITVHEAATTEADPPGGLDPSTPDGWDNSTGKE